MGAPIIMQMICSDIRVLDGLLDKFRLWKDSIESKGLLANMGKTKIMISDPQLDTLKDSRKHPCSVCRKGAASNSIYCNG